jgi:hydrogenase maturation protease
MTAILVAGIGNVFFGDDGFGVEVARRLALEPVPAGTTVADFGIRGMHLAFELIAPPDLLVIVDAVHRDGPPGTLYLIDPEVEPCAGTSPDAHGMDLGAVFGMLREMGGQVPPTRIVGCEPADLGERMELSPSVRRSIEPAIAMIREVIDSNRSIPLQGESHV